MSKNYIIENTSKLTIKDIEALYYGKAKVACLALREDKFDNVNYPAADDEKYYVEGITRDVDVLMYLIVNSNAIGEKEKAEAYLNIFNKCVMVEKVCKLNIQKSYVYEAYIGNNTHYYNVVVNFDGYALDATNLKPSLCEYLEFKARQFNQIEMIKVRPEKYDDCLEDIKILEK